jgi:ribosomal protein S8
MENNFGPKVIIKTEVYADSCALCDTFLILDLEKKEETMIFANIVSSDSWEQIKRLMKESGFVQSFEKKEIIKVYCPIWNDTFYSVNIPFNSKDRNYKSEIVILIQKNSDKKMWIKLESYSIMNSELDFIMDSSTVIVNKSETSPINTNILYPDYSIFTTTSNQFYFSLGTLPISDVYIIPNSTAINKFLICFANCYDPCAATCYHSDEDETGECLSFCYTVCKTKCFLSEWWE